MSEMSFMEITSPTARTEVEELFQLSQDLLLARKGECHPLKALEILERCVNAGHYTAMYQVGLFGLYNRLAFTLPRQRCRELFAEAIKGGVQLALVHSLSSGLTVDPDVDAAFALLSTLDLSSPWVSNDLGYFYQLGTGCKQNIPRAVELYQLAASQGAFWAKTNLTFCYANYAGFGKKAHQLAIQYLLETMPLGDGFALIHYGGMFEVGLCRMEKDPARAFKLYHDTYYGDSPCSAQLGLALARCYLGGVGTPIDQAKALEILWDGFRRFQTPDWAEWLCSLLTDQDELTHVATVGASNDSTHCMVLLAQAADSLDQTLAWSLKAAKFNDKDALLMLGRHYFDGSGQDELIDYQKAHYYYERAKLKILMPACHYLGHMYEHGLGCKKDLKRAKELYLAIAANSPVCESRAKALGAVRS